MAAAKIAMPAPATAPSDTPRQFSVVLAVDEAFGIGKAGGIPWNSPEDRAYFKDLTTKAAKGKLNAVVMGVATYCALPPKVRPLPGRVNIVMLTKGRSVQPQVEDMLSAPADAASPVVLHRGTLLELLTGLGARTPPAHLAAVAPLIDRVFIGGGRALYAESIFSPALRPSLQALFVTRVAGKYDCDAIVALPAEVKDITQGLVLETRIAAPEGATIPVSFETWTPGNAEERQYLELCRNIIDNGCRKGDRTGTGTLSIFGAQMRFSLRDGVFPLLTTKRVFYRGIVEELLWFLRGDTDGLHLSEKGVHIWDANGSREFLDGRGLTSNRVGDLGPVYGFQWRHFGAEYTTCDADYTGKGVDQIREVIQTLRTNPNDRRMVVTAWNPAALSKMALPPCHMFAQFYVNDKQELSCMLYQRSCDMGLGVPFNIASYALLTTLMAKAANLQLGEFVHTLGDAHVYTNHVDAVREQLQRAPRAFPKLVIKADREFLEDYTADDFELRDYFPYPTIKMDMAV